MIIAFTGKMGSGKSTACELMQWELDRRGIKCYTLPFAKPLKELAYNIGWDGVKDGKGRKFLQDLASTIRAYNPNYFVNKWKVDYECYINKYPQHVIFVDDLRFDNEAEVITKYEANIIEIYGRSNPSSVDTINHESEKGIDSKYIKYAINNSKNIYPFISQIYNTLEDIFKPMLV